MEESLGAVPLEALHKFRCGSSDDLESEIGGFALEIVKFAVCDAEHRTTPLLGRRSAFRGADRE
jgi:hypothetical protein